MRSTLVRRVALTVVTTSTVVAATLAGGTIQQATAVGTTYYVDCSASTNGTGLSTGSPWNAVASVNSHAPFAPGDQILLRRGTGVACTGMLAPPGSGSAGSPIQLGTYGTGAQPVVNGGANQAAIRLIDQEYWEISGIETTGGNPYGIYVGGTTPGTTLDYIRITDVTVHDVGGNATDANGGGVIVRPLGNNQKFNDVIIDGALVYNTHQWSGINVGANGSNTSNWNGASQVLNTNVTVRNSTVHDVWGSGITVFETNGGVMENNVAYNTGLMPSASWNPSMPSPNGIWGWYCHNCVTQFNESYNSFTPWLDGGAFDIDYYSVNQTVQYNYGHDSAGYCVAILGADGYTTQNSIVRYNVCANNARRDSTLPTPSGPFITTGDVFIFTWNGGSVSGTQVYNNTFFWNPQHDDALLNASVPLTGANNFFKNNIIRGTKNKMIDSVTSLTVDNNLYYTTASTPSWKYGATTYPDFGSYVAGSGQDKAGMYADPKLSGAGNHGVGMPTTDYTLLAGSPAVDRGATIAGAGSRDFFGNVLGQGNGTDIGAHESSQTANLASGRVSVNAGGAAVGTFLADDNYSGGATFSTVAAIDTSAAGGAAPAAVYQSERYGTFTYSIGGLAPNAGYLVRLHEAEIFHNSAGARRFNVAANGVAKLTNFDIFAAAGAKNKAIVVDFYAVADGSGRLALQFTPGTADQPKVSGIEIFQGAPGPSAVNAGGPAVDWFVADTGSSGGTTSSTTDSIDVSAPGTGPLNLYKNVRVGSSFSYTVGGLTPSAPYLVRLHEAEIVHTSAGARRFNVAANGVSKLTNFDIFAAAGGHDKAIVVDFHATANGSGQIVLDFTTGTADQPAVAAVEILRQ